MHHSWQDNEKATVCIVKYVLSILTLNATETSSNVDLFLLLFVTVMSGSPRAHSSIEGLALGIGAYLDSAIKALGVDGAPLKVYMMVQHARTSLAMLLNCNDRLGIQEIAFKFK